MKHEFETAVKILFNHGLSCMCVYIHTYIYSFRNVLKIHMSACDGNLLDKTIRKHMVINALNFSFFCTVSVKTILRNEN